MGRKTGNRKDAVREGGVLVAQVHQLAGRVFSRILRNHGIEDLNPAQGRIVYALWKESPLSQAQLSERTRLDNQTRTRFGNILARIEPPLKMLLDDQNGEKHFLQNPDDKVQFDIDSATKRRLEGYTIIEAIQETYNFIAALRFRLLEGDLSGIGAKTDQVIVYDTAADRNEESEADEDDADPSPESGEESPAEKG